MCTLFTVMHMIGMHPMGKHLLACTLLAWNCAPLNNMCAAPPAYYAHLVAFRARFYSDEDASDTRSQGSRGMGAGEGAASSSSSRLPEDIVVRPLPGVCPSVSRRMFFT